MATHDNLATILDSLIQEKTFSLEGVKAIEAVRQKVGALQFDLDASAKRNEDLSKRLEEVQRSLTEAVVAKKEFTARESSISQRESKVLELEMTAAVERAKSAVYDSVFTRIFQNRIFRENMTNSIPVSVPQGGGVWGSQHESKSRMVEES